MAASTRTTEASHVFPSRLLITGLPECDRKLVISTLKEAAGEVLQDWEFNESEHSVLVEIKTMNGLSRVLTKAPIVIKGKQTKVSLYYPESPNPDIQDVVEVIGITNDVTKESLMLHFENTRRSGGGKVLRMNVDYHNNTAHIRFNDKQAACRVTCKYRHVVDGVEVRVIYPEQPEKFYTEVFSPPSPCPPPVPPIPANSSTTVDATVIPKLTPGTMVTSVDRKEKIAIRETRDRRACSPGGVCSLPDGGWLVTDYNNHVLKRLDVSGSVVDRCPVPGDPFDVCFIQDHNVASVTTGNANRIELISLDGDMTRVRTIQTDHHCLSVTYANNKLYVTSDGTEIYEYRYCDGQLYTISPRDWQGKERFVYTQYITSSENGSRLFMTDRYRGLFIIDTRTADVLIQQVDVGRDLAGVCLGEDDGLFVVSCGDRTITHLNRNGRKLGTVVTREMIEGHKPLCVSYDKRTARLAVTVDRVCDYIFVFHMK